MLNNLFVYNYGTLDMSNDIKDISSYQFIYRNQSSIHIIQIYRKNWVLSNIAWDHLV